MTFRQRFRRACVDVVMSSLGIWLVISIVALIQVIMTWFVPDWKNVIRVLTGMWQLSFLCCFGTALTVSLAGVIIGDGEEPCSG